MTISVELLSNPSYLIRFHESGGYGKPATATLIMTIHGDTAELKGLDTPKKDGHRFKLSQAKAITDLLRKNGIKYFWWERRNDDGKVIRVVRFQITKDGIKRIRVIPTGN